MKNPNFLDKLKDEGKLQLVEPSEEICSSYMGKAENCLKSASILLGNGLYENSVSMSYYAMYNSLTALLFRTGIKCENHAGSIILLGKLYNKDGMHKIISSAKKERIDKQYYVDFMLTKDSAKELFKKAEEFVVQLKLIVSSLKNEEIDDFRKRFYNL